MKFEEACSEVDYILENLQPSDKEKIPKYVIEFFKNNKSIFYKVNLTTEKKLIEQNLKDETKAFLQIINYKYFSNEKQRETFKKMLLDFEENKEILTEKINVQQKQEMVVYKENKLKKILKKIIEFFRKKN